MNNINYDEELRTTHFYQNIPKSQRNEPAIFLNKEKNNEHLKSNNGFDETYTFSIHNYDNVIKMNEKKELNKVLLNYELGTQRMECFVGIDNENVLYIKEEYINHINSKNILVIINLFVCNLFYHLKNIGKNIHNLYLSFDKIVSPFHFSFNNNFCEKCISDDNQNFTCTEHKNYDFSELSEKNSEQARRKKKKDYKEQISSHNYNKTNSEHTFMHTCKKKEKNEYLPNVLILWCKRVKYAINIYNNNNNIKIKKKKKILEQNGQTDNNSNNLFCDEKSRYSINECINTLTDAIFNKKNLDIFNNIHFLFPKEKSSFTNKIKHIESKRKIEKIPKEKSPVDKNTSTHINGYNNKDFLLFVDKDTLNYNLDKDDNVIEEITDLYIINYIKCKIEDYFKNVEVKKFWNIINVQYLTNFDYKYPYNKRGNEKTFYNSNKNFYESIYDYIQIIRKTTVKKDIKINEISKNCDENNINKKEEKHVTIPTTPLTLEKGRILDKEFILKDMFNNPIKNYHINEVQIYLSNYDNIFLKTIMRFYLLLNFSIELLTILYEDIDLYSIHIFYLYEKLNEYIYNEHQLCSKKGNFNIHQIYQSEDKSGDFFEHNGNNLSHFFKNNIYEMTRMKNNNDDTFHFINSNLDDDLNYRNKNNNKTNNVNMSNNNNNNDIINNVYNFLFHKNTNHNIFLFKEKKLDWFVFFLLKILMRKLWFDKHDDHDNYYSENNNNHHHHHNEYNYKMSTRGKEYQKLLNSLNAEKYKEIQKEIKALIKYTLEKRKIHFEPIINYLLNIYNKYNKKRKALNNNKIVNSKYASILKKNFLLYSLDFYTLKYFSRRDLYVNMNGFYKPRRKKYELKIPRYNNKMKEKMNRYKKYVRTFHSLIIKIQEVTNESRKTYNDNNLNSSSRDIFFKINKFILLRKSRMIYLRQLKKRVYSYYSLIPIYGNIQQTEKRRNKKILEDNRKRKKTKKNKK
ncbi:hypothetical protein PFFVO_06006, partial [Plasmodium falciparum Vietnam Oak-Knoll (FVO)]